MAVTSKTTPLPCLLRPVRPPCSGQPYMWKSINLHRLKEEQSFSLSGRPNPTQVLGGAPLNKAMSTLQGRAGPWGGVLGNKKGCRGVFPAPGSRSNGNRWKRHCLGSFYKNGRNH